MVPDTEPRSNTPSVPPYTPLFPVSLIVFDFTLSVRELGVYVFPHIPKPSKDRKIRVFHGDRLQRICCRYDSHPTPESLLVCHGDTVDCT